MKRALLGLSLLAALLVPSLGASVAAAVPASSDGVTATETVIVNAQGSGGLTLQLDRPVTVATLGGVTVDLMGQQAAFVQLVPSKCRFPHDDNWCPEHATLALKDAQLSSDSTNNSVSFSTSNSPNILAGPLDVYVLSTGPVRITITMQGLDKGVTQVTPDRQVDGVLRKLPNLCEPQFGDCRTVARGHATETVGKRGSSIVYVVSRTRRELIEGEGDSDFAASKGNVACGYSKDRGGSIDPADHDGGCDTTPRADDDRWRSNAVNYYANAHPVMGSILGFASYGSSQTGLLYHGFNGHALSAHDLAVQPGSAYVSAWGAWLRAGLR